MHNPGRKESPNNPGDQAEPWERSAPRERLCHAALWICLGDKVSVAFISQICKCVSLTAGLTRKQSRQLTDRRGVLLCIASTHRCRLSPADPLPWTRGMDVMKSIQQNLCMNMKYFLGVSRVPVSPVYSFSKTLHSVV